jgi:hypothetical protein
MAELLAPNPVRHVLHFHGLSGAGHSDRKIVEPDPAAFVVRDDKPGSLESVENDPSRLIKAHKR